MVNPFTIASIIRIETVVPPDASQRGAEGFAKKQGVSLLLGRCLVGFHNGGFVLRDLSYLEPVG